ncbi:MAG: hypothetical protein RL681_531 [Candidatus Parcubacteria bacterium]|jgi:hypothetical protein
MQGNPLLRSQNLVSQVSAKEFTRPAGFYKSIFVDFAGVCFALLAGLSYDLYLQAAIPLWVVLVAAGLFMIASTIGALLMESPFRRAWVLLAETGALLAFFYTMPIVNLLALGAIVFVFLLWGDVTTHRELTGNIEVRYMRITRSQMRKLTTALIVAAIALYLPQWTPQGGFLPPDAFQNVFTWSAGMATRFYPGIRFNATVDSFLSDSAAYQLNQDAKYNALPPVAQEQALKRSINELSVMFHNAIGIETGPQEQMQNVLYRFILGALDDWNRTFGTNLIIAWAVVAYFLLRSIGIVYYTAVSFFGFLIFQLLLAMNFTMIIGETRVQQTLQYT